MLATPGPAVSPTRARSHGHGETALAAPFGDPAHVPGRADLPPERHKRVDLSLGPRPGPLAQGAVRPPTAARPTLRGSSQGRSPLGTQFWQDFATNFAIDLHHVTIIVPV